MADVDTDLERRLERVLIRYNAPSELTMMRDGQAHMTDRGDLSSDLADVARAWFDEQSVSKQGKAPQAGPSVPLSQRPTDNVSTSFSSQLTVEQRVLLHDDKGASEEMCTRCGWVMGHPPLNCQNDNSPHVFPSQLADARS